MSFIVENVKRFLEINTSLPGMTEKKKMEILQRAEDFAYLGRISGAHMYSVMLEYTSFFNVSLEETKEQSDLFYGSLEEFNKKDAALKQLKDDVENLLLTNGFCKHEKMKRRGFEILDTATDMPAYNTVGKLAKEKVKDLGIVIMSIGFGEIKFDRIEGRQYETLLKANGFVCKLFNTPDYPKATGAVYLYVKVSEAAVFSSANKKQEA